MFGNGTKMSDFFSLTAPTAQQVFDHVVTGVIAQGTASIQPDGSCLYRGPNGLKCAAGQALSDDDYRAEFESKRAYSIDLPERLKPYRHLLTRLQYAHDSAANGPASTFLAAFLRKCTVIASENDLIADAVIENKKNPT